MPRTAPIVPRWEWRTFGAGVYQISQLVDTFFATSLPQGSLSLLKYADRLNQMPLGIFGIALGTAESQVWAQLGRPARIHRGFLRYCLAGGRKLMIGVPGDRSGTGGEPGAAPSWST